MTGITRILHIIDGDRSSPMRVDIGYPIQTLPTEFRCDLTLGSPDGADAGAVYGIDSVQALSLTLNMIAVRLYVSDLHKQKKLYWQGIGDGYGFPLGVGVKDLADGGDKSL